MTPARLRALVLGGDCRRSLEWRAADDEGRIAQLLVLAARDRLAGWVLIPSGVNEAALVA
jgi:predicted ATP-grasp superfamily ATP-dependent carboligase